VSVGLPHHVCPAAQTELVARFEREAVPLLDSLYGGAMRLTGSHQDAEDLLQDTMLHAYAGFYQYREGTSIKAWLYRIMHNRWIDRHRRKQRRPQEVSMERTVTPQLCSAEISVLEALPDQEIKEALMALPEPQRMAIYLADVEGFAYREIATMMGTSVGTVMSRLHRGRVRLRSTLWSVACRRHLVCASSSAPSVLG
jgi:RNA polymerase sigma-70 factor (ECF subfamily)